MEILNTPNRTFWSALPQSRSNFDDVTFANEPRPDFWAAMAKLDAEIARFQTAVDKCCAEMQNFKANL
jgi:cytochrome c556